MKQNTKQQLCVNKESDFIQELEYEQRNQNYNYPPQQQYSQQYPTIADPKIQNQQTSIQNQFSQQQTQVQVNTDNHLLNDEDLALHNTAQKRSFSLTIVSLWALQILIQLIIVWQGGIHQVLNSLYLIPGFVISLLILIYTLFDNYPVNKENKVRVIDILIFVVYYMADLFTMLFICFILNEDYLTYFIIITRITQCSNLVCSSLALMRTQQKLLVKHILVLTLIPFGIMLFLSLIFTEWLRSGIMLYVLAILMQMFQVVFSYNLVRVIEGIYGKQNKRIDINNIYTGFILFKISYYTPF